MVPRAVCGIVQGTVMPPLGLGSRLNSLAFKNAVLRRHGFNPARSGTARSYASTVSSSSSSYTTGSSQQIPRVKEPSKRWRNLAIVAGLGGTAYLADRELNASAIERTLRCAFYG